MDEHLKEIEGLLDTQQVHEPRSIKKYIKLVLPHVALVAVVCLYAVIGAWIFYSLESPNEDSLKHEGRRSIAQARDGLVERMWQREGMARREWKAQVQPQLENFNQLLYKAFKEQYVRYADVRVEERSERLKRARASKTRSDKAAKLWTASSALFFAATTMATIGYGNIVPVTPQGRIACVVFALFGAPLAIITIGDLGKFLSECTIWLYKRMKKAKILLRARFRRWRASKGAAVSEDSEADAASSHSTLDWEDLVMDKTEVPVLLVFTILLLYIAFGGVLFAFLEDWSYMDAFYYSFISLTTIGFGDIVPENHEYILLMLVYLGVGLAVTTMCIDLVGIQYIQKIHYFGRKFRGTDLLHLLKRKRMIERRLAMGQGEEILQMYIQQITSQIPEPMVVADEWDVEKCSSDYLSDTLVDEAVLVDLCRAEKVPSPTILSIRSYHPPSIYSNSSASARSMMYQRGWGRGESWDESGPSLSSHCSLSTEPSVHMRTHYWDNYRTPSPSVLSFKYDFPLPEPDLRIIAEMAKRSRRVRSCPSQLWEVPTPCVSVRRRRTSSLTLLPCVRQAPPAPLSLPPVDSFEISPPFMLSKLAAQCDLIDRLPLLFRERSPSKISTSSQLPSDHLAHPRVTQPSVKLHVPRLQLPSSPPTSSRLPPKSFSSRFSSRTPLHPIPELLRVASPASSSPAPSVSPLPILRRKKKERRAKKDDPLRNMDWLNISPRTKLLQAVKRDLPTLFNAVRRPSANSQASQASVVLVSPRNPIGLACMEDWDSYIRMLEDYSKPYVRRQETPEVTVLVESSHTDDENEDEVATTADDEEHVLSPMGGESSSECDSPAVFDIDLGAFELVDSGLSAETLLSHEDPVIYHRDMPVHSVHHDTVQTEAALENLMNAPESMLSSMVPPTMVEDNYCFVVDGDKIRMGDIMGDDQWWRHTSRPTKYFYSDDMKKFHRVNVITAKGKVISAKLVTQQGSGGMGFAASPNQASMSSTPRSSVSGGSSRASTAKGGAGGTEKVPLVHVYKVIRFYSFWKTCTSFHRIVTMIDRVGGDDRNANPDFKKRLFVQYLWRNAKAVEKARVQKEFDPRRQRLLRFVTDPAARKKALHM